MTSHIATFKPLGGHVHDAKDLSLTAFFGGREGGYAVQVSVGGNFTPLSERQVRKLIDLLQQRVDGTITSTGPDLDIEVEP